MTSYKELDRRTKAYFKRYRIKGARPRPRAKGVNKHGRKK